jgi:hypothetical protein
MLHACQSNSKLSHVGDCISCLAVLHSCRTNAPWRMLLLSARQIVCR